MRFLFIVFFSILAFSCSSKPKDSANQSQDSASNKLELNGSSDNNTAGGLRTVYFMKDSSDLTASSKSALKDNAAFLNSHSKVAIQIEGHCDERGGRQYNLSLGERRAKTTKQYLLALGVSAKQMTTVSYGNERPLEEGHEEDAWSKNRRANFSITAK